jgi:hypothetical protein
MNAKNLWIAALSGAVLTTLVSNLPVVGFINLLLCAGFWGSAVFAVWLYRRLNGNLTLGQGVGIGALTGLLAGALGFSISFLGLAGLQGIVNGLKLFVPSENLGDIQYSLGEAIPFNLVGASVNVIFGVIGGMLGGAIFRTSREPSQKAVAEQA